MNPVVLFREDTGVPNAQEELLSCRKFFRTETSRSEAIKDSLVVCRYSALPFYAELEDELRSVGSTIINSYTQHRFAAGFGYYETIADITPATWFRIEDIPKTGAFVVKGRTNSRKHQWKELMYAPDRAAAIRIGKRLMDDPMIREQGVIYRRFVPLEIVGHASTGMPMGKEWRFFCHRDHVMAGGSYWTEVPEALDVERQEAASLARKAAGRLCKHITFFAVDIAKTESGDYTVIEVNDGQSSGLSHINPDFFYKRLSRAVSGFWNRPCGPLNTEGEFMPCHNALPRLKPVLRSTEDKNDKENKENAGQRQEKEQPEEKPCQS